ncbi:hypothetical protein B5X24_HaOG200965 [Helicoverpa armigera]|nr:hypothetical protein B5X24_HaOG200965 [Helicoverpa armigera]
MQEVKKLTKTQISAMWLVIFFTSARAFLGCYKKISESKLICFLFRIYCIFISFTLVAYYFRDNIDTGSSSHMLVIIEYIIIVIFHMFTGDTYMRTFVNAIKMNDRIMGFKGIPTFTKYVYLLMFLGTVSKTVAGSFRYMYSLATLLRCLTIGAILVSVDFNQLTIIISFSMLHYRMKVLRRFIDSNSVPVNITGRDKVAISIRNTKMSLFYYNNLLDSLQLINKELQFLVKNKFCY